MRKPNYDFERKERERLKQLKTAARKEAKLKPVAEEAAGKPVGEAGAEKPEGE